MNAPKIYTATDIARALGCSRQNVHKALVRIPADGEKLVAGNLAKAWCVGSLPLAIVDALGVIAKAKRYPTIETLLDDPFARYEVRNRAGQILSVIEIASAARDRAFRLRNALRPILQIRNDCSFSVTEFEERGLASYRREFGGAITAKHWRELLNRTVDRDNGAEEWDRLEIYVEEAPARISAIAPVSESRARRFEILEDAFISLSESNKMSALERSSYLWTKACDELRVQKEAIIKGEDRAKTKGEDRAKIGRVKGIRAKRHILSILLKSGLLGKDLETLRKTFSRKLAVYEATGGRAIIDRRTLRVKEKLPQSDAHVIAGHAHAHGGDLSRGWESARESGGLSPDTEQRYATNCYRVPQRVRRDVGPLVRSTAACVRGEKAAAVDGPSQHGDYTSLHSGEVFEMDDWTPEHVAYDELDPTQIFQGQVIALIDQASRRVLEFGYVQGSYHGRVIRSVVANACKNYCLPERLHVEGGLWERAKTIVGSRNKVLSLERWEMGLRAFMNVTHARKARAKANIENHFNALGKEMRPWIGWCGNDMRSTISEDLRRNIALARSGKLHPSQFCLSKQQLINALEESFEKYNGRPQRSGRLNGISPNQAWDAMQSLSGRPSLGTKGAFLMAYDQEPMLIKKGQIKKVIGGIEHFYHSADTARWNERKIVVWSHPDDAGQIGITSLDLKEGPFVVPLQERTPQRANPDYETIGRVQRAIDETNRVRKSEYRSIQPHLAKARLRPTLIDPITTDVGHRLHAGVADVKKETSRIRAGARKARAQARELGIRVQMDNETAERTAAGIDLIAQALQEVPTPEKETYRK